MKQILFILGIITFLSCTKEEPEPKPLKPNEADTMRALINGEEWSAYCESSWPGLGCTKVNCQYYPDDKGFEISAAGPPGYVVIVSKSGGTGGVKLGINKLPFRRGPIICNTSSCKSTCRRFDIDTTFFNVLEILEIDSTIKIIEGRFNFRVINEECSDTILVSDGYFRTNYRS